jgi:hypothetical protein
LFVAQSGDYPYEDLAKPGYKQENKIKNFNHLYFWLHEKIKYMFIWLTLLFFFPSLLATENLQNHFILNFEFFSFAFWQKIPLV